MWFIVCGSHANDLCYVMINILSNVVFQVVGSFSVQHKCSSHDFLRLLLNLTNQLVQCLVFQLTAVAESLVKSFSCYFQPIF